MKTQKAQTGNLVVVFALVVALIAGGFWAMHLRANRQRQNAEEAAARLRLKLGSPEERARIDTGKRIGEQVDEARRKFASEVGQ